MVVGAKHGVTVGEVEKQHTSEVLFVHVVTALIVPMAHAPHHRIFGNRTASPRLSDNGCTTPIRCC